MEKTAPPPQRKRYNLWWPPVSPCRKGYAIIPIVLAGVAKWSKAQGLGPCLVGVRGFDSRPPHLFGPYAIDFGLLTNRFNGIICWYFGLKIGPHGCPFSSSWVAPGPWAFLVGILFGKSATRNWVFKTEATKLVLFADTIPIPDPPPKSPIIMGSKLSLE